MSVAAFCRVVREQWQSLTELVWPEDTQQRTQAEIARLTGELEIRYRSLVKRRQHIETLRDQLAVQERQLASSTSQPSLVRAVDRKRNRLLNQEAEYARRQKIFVKRKNLQRALVRGQVIVLADPGNEEKEGDE